MLGADSVSAEEVGVFPIEPITPVVKPVIEPDARLKSDQAALKEFAAITLVRVVTVPTISPVDGVDLTTSRLLVVRIHPKALNRLPVELHTQSRIIRNRHTSPLHDKRIE